MTNRARLACIFTPMILTIAAFTSLFAVGIGGFLNERNGEDGTYENDGPMTALWFLEADFSETNLEHAASSNFTSALQHSQGNLDKFYKIYLWDYCKSRDGNGYWCSGRYAGGYFNFVEFWGLEGAVNGSVANSTRVEMSTPTRRAAEEARRRAASADQFEQEELGNATAEAFKAYREVAHWMAVAYGFAIWTGLATVFCGVFAMCSRWGSFLTWILSIISSVFTFAAALTSTTLFSALAAALKAAFSPYNIHIKLGSAAIGITWLAVIFNLSATFFWLFSICCCAGRSNPHHWSNKGGTMWNADGANPSHVYGGPRMQGYSTGSRSYLKVGKSRDSYAASETVLLRDFSGPMGQGPPSSRDFSGQSLPPASPGFEPVRRNSR